MTTTSLSCQQMTSLRECCVSVFIPLFFHFLNTDFQKFHLPKQFGKHLVHKLFLALGENLLLRIWRNEIAQSTLIVDYLLACQQLVSLHCGIGVHLQRNGILSDRWYSVVGLV